MIARHVLWHDAIRSCSNNYVFMSYEYVETMITAENAPLPYKCFSSEFVEISNILKLSETLLSSLDYQSYIIIDILYIICNGSFICLNILTITKQNLVFSRIFISLLIGNESYYKVVKPAYSVLLFRD